MFLFVYLKMVDKYNISASFVKFFSVATAFRILSCCNVKEALFFILISCN
jgi:hypothetical protein